MENTSANELDLTGSGLNDINMWAANGFAGQQVNLTGQQIICCPVGKRLLGGKRTCANAACQHVHDQKR